jgi:CheY-like chemotaxis protein/anti-sigma regulatory factor (Ser/Thr protein kinase)
MSTGAILVVDDTIESLKLLTEVLTAEGYHVRPANSGELALTSAGACPPELVLLDIRMPGMDGFEVCRQLKSNPGTRDLPIIFISATPEVEERVEGLKCGAVDFITKPFQREEMLARVHTHLELGRLRSKLELLVAERTTELNEANELLRKAAIQQRKFLRDILASVTDGALILCHQPDDLPHLTMPFGEAIPLSSSSGLTELRGRVKEAAVQLELSTERTYDLITGAHEAAMNAVVHAGIGVAQVFTMDSGLDKVQVRVQDSGPGITMDNIPQATLRRGYTTAGTLGHGVKMMLSMIDKVYLMTGPTGTTVVLEQNKQKQAGPYA